MTKHIDQPAGYAVRSALHLLIHFLVFSLSFFIFFFFSFSLLVSQVDGDGASVPLGVHIGSLWPCPCRSVWGSGLIWPLIHTPLAV